MRFLKVLGGFCKSTLTYTLLLFGASIGAILLTVSFMPEPPLESDDPCLVTRADSWPASKQKHMEEGDLWYWIEHRTSSWAKGSENVPRSEVPALEFAREWIPGVNQYHQLEILLWCILLPGFVFSAIGGGIAAHRAASHAESLVAAAVPVATTVLVFSTSSDALYIGMWDASIHWANWLGSTYYDFTVRFFVIGPLLAIGTGVTLLLERGRQVPVRSDQTNVEQKR